MTKHKSHNPLWFTPESMVHYDPLGVHPHAIPTEGIFDDPKVKVCINARWASHLTGMIERLIYLDAWEGTEAEKYAAIDKVVKIIAEFDKAENQGTCEDMYIRFRYKPEDNRVTQVQYVEGGEWTDAFNLTCCEPTQPTNYQFTPDGEMQVSYDGGETWEHDPNDPRDNVTILPPPVGATTSETRCMVAQSVTGSIRAQQEQISADAELWAGVNTLTAALIGLLIFIGIIGSGGALTPLLLGLAAALLTAGKTAFDAAMTSGVYQTLQCIVYCSVKDDGSIDALGMSVIREKLRAQLTGVALKFIDDTIGIWQLSGLNNAGHSGITTEFTCDECDCPDCVLDYDFRTASFADKLTLHEGTWISGDGWKATSFGHSDQDYYTARVRVIFAEPCTSNTIRIEYFIDGSSGVNARAGLQSLIKNTAGEYVWQGGFNMPPSSGEHDHTELRPNYFEPMYGIEFFVTNIGTQKDHVIRHFQIIS